MTNTQIGSMVNVGVSNVIDEKYDIGISLARDFLKGETSDYLFWYNGVVVQDGAAYSEFVLLVGDMVRDPSQYPPVYEFENVSVRQFYVLSELHISTETSQFHGQVLEADPTPVSSFSGSIASSSSYYTYSTFSFSYSIPRCQVSNSAGQCFYSNYAADPHLIEGVENYAFAGFCLAAMCIGFCLLDRLFRRVY